MVGLVHHVGYLLKQRLMQSCLLRRFQSLFVGMVFVTLVKIVIVQKIVESLACFHGGYSWL
ncbi:hypothetical protein A3K72_02955 [Candidatus Woesearchaeota archaeon RBG_13_36_6]|nr:MAG: hypothetical protein A3K72_02955 [Candidatus Woesearchaeota archaeon RBG_13_36_6]